MQVFMPNNTTKKPWSYLADINTWHVAEETKLLRQPPLPKKEPRHSVAMTPTNWTTVSQGWKI
jgi:hypothetical protein